MAFFKNIFASTSSSSSVSSERSASSSNSVVDAFHAPTIRYGAEDYVKPAKYHQDQGYFNNKTKVARNSMYNVSKQRR